MSEPVFIIGGAQTDFSRNYSREDLTIFDLLSEVMHEVFDRTGVNPNDVDVGHVGNFVGELFTGQGMLGGLYGHALPELAGVPVSRHEGACASGSLAVLAAMAGEEQCTKLGEFDRVAEEQKHSRPVFEKMGRLLRKSSDRLRYRAKRQNEVPKADPSIDNCARSGFTEKRELSPEPFRQQPR